MASQAASVSQTNGSSQASSISSTSAMTLRSDLAARSAFSCVAVTAKWTPRADIALISQGANERANLSRLIARPRIGIPRRAKPRRDQFHSVRFVPDLPFSQLEPRRLGIRPARHLRGRIDVIPVLWIEEFDQPVQRVVTLFDHTHCGAHGNRNELGLLRPVQLVRNHPALMQMRIANGPVNSHDQILSVQNLRSGPKTGRGDEG